MALDRARSVARRPFGACRFLEGGPSIFFVQGADLREEKEPFGEAECGKVLERIASMKNFLEKVRFCTMKEEAWRETVKDKLRVPIAYLRALLEDRGRFNEAEVRKALVCLEEIEGTVERI